LELIAAKIVNLAAHSLISRMFNTSLTLWSTTTTK
jgi:hypothetical protein